MLFGAGTDRLGRPVEQAVEDELEHSAGQVPLCLASGRSQKRRDVEPLEAVVAKGSRALPLESSHGPEHRLQPEAELNRSRTPRQGCRGGRPLRPRRHSQSACGWSFWFARDYISLSRRTAECPSAHACHPSRKLKASRT